MSADAMAVRFSDWITLDAARVRAFAEVTDDWQAIHLDEAFAAETPFGGTVAHGFLTLSMLSAMSYQVTAEDAPSGMSVNYGFDRIRFVTPVRVGSRIRGRFELEDETRGATFTDRHWDVSVEIDGAARPALVAHWITRIYDEDASDAARAG
ncbi:MaoC family dehydratase [Cognatishimia sp. F0-27]|uniref:MaoC family dehydratase n=1 Tax=Cognatishimia sp. F0-27 TaxID=2816855 RepID=UPI001D0C3221|nr:MaoC family dehydratase [Cognatishimia sp. F0-27]MCC1491670.1 MaoC family dehydratase [Cognatishimia sp. F0-27]